MVNEHWKIPFGYYKGTKIRDCPDIFLRWCATKLRDTNLHDFAIGAQTELDNRSDDKGYQDLEEEADKILRQHGCDPKRM